MSGKRLARGETYRPVYPEAKGGEGGRQNQHGQTNTTFISDTLQRQVGAEVGHRCMAAQSSAAHSPH